MPAISWAQEVADRSLIKNNSAVVIPGIPAGNCPTPSRVLGITRNFQEFKTAWLWHLGTGLMVALAVLGCWLDLMISEGFSSLDGSVIVGISGCCCHPCFGFHTIWEEQEHVQMCFTFLFQRKVGNCALKIKVVPELQQHIGGDIKGERAEEFHSALGKFE